MNEENEQLDIIEAMKSFLRGIAVQYFEGRQDVVIYQKKKKLTLYVPNEDSSDATLVRCTRVDDTSVSFVVYQDSKPEVKLYMGHYNKSCNDPERNAAKLTKLAVDISIPLMDKQESDTSSEIDQLAHTVKVEDIVRITSVETTRVMELHNLAVSFDGQEPVHLSVPKEQLDVFTIGNKMVRMPFGFQLLERNPVIH